MKMQGFIFIIVSTYILPLPKPAWVCIPSSPTFVLDRKQNWGGQSLQSSGHQWVKWSFGITWLARVQQGSLCPAGCRSGGSMHEREHTEDRESELFRDTCRGSSKNWQKRVSKVHVQVFVLSWRPEPEQLMCCVCAYIYLKNPLQPLNPFLIFSTTEVFSIALHEMMGNEEQCFR